MNPLVLAGAGLVALLVLSGGGDTQAAHQPRGPSPDPWPLPEDEIPGVNTPGSPPGEVARAFLAEIEAQSLPGKGTEMRRLLDRFLTFGTPQWAATALPCDQRFPGVPDSSYWDRISSALADAYGVDVVLLPMEWTSRDRGPVQMCIVVFYTKGTRPPDADFLLKGLTEHAQQELRSGQPIYQGTTYGAIDVIGLVIQTAIQAAVGTVVSMGVQDWVRSLGGERRLARLVRRYKKTGNPRIKERILRTATRLKGRKVDWSEIEGLAAQEGHDLTPPMPT